MGSKCYEGTHLFFTLVLAIPSTILWCVGIPLFAVMLLVNNKNTLYLMDKKDLTDEEKEQIKMVKTKYGFLLGGY